MSTFDNAWYGDLSRTQGTNEAIMRVWQFKKVLGLKTRSTEARFYKDMITVFSVIKVCL